MKIKFPTTLEQLDKRYRPWYYEFVVEFGRARKSRDVTKLRELIERIEDDARGLDV